MSDGATKEEQLRAAAKSDSVELAQDALKGMSKGKGVDLNAQDGLGMTALHYSIKHEAYEVMELLLDTDGTDVDLQNRLEGDTPLHLAARLQEGPRKAFLASLLDAGADPRIRNKREQAPIDLLPSNATDERAILREFEAERAMGLDHAVGADDNEAAEGSSGGED